MREAKDVAWLAGLLEGEGCFELRKEYNGRRKSLRVALNMTDKDVVERAAAIFPSPTCISEKELSGIDKQGRDRSTWGVTYVKVWNGKEAELLMRAVLPYMGKRRAAKIRECLSAPNLSHQPKAVV